MKAKACTKCRQWKARCDYDKGAEGCARCRSLGMTCVFDASFRRTSKSKSLQRMSSEIQRLRQALDNANADGCISTQSATIEPSDRSLVHNDRSPSQPVSLAPEQVVPAQYRTIGNVTLSSGQVNEHFRTYFARCHQFLPFKMITQSPDAIYENCPLLFWVICAAAANGKLRSQLAPLLKPLLADTIHSPPRTIATIQALLIMSTWPFSVTSVTEDPSDFYCGIATQMALRLGLHRPSQSHLHAYGSEEHANARFVDREVQITTWLACFIVSQRHFLLRGVPQPAWVDVHLLKAFDDALVDPVLAQLCRIYHTLMQAYLSIGAKAPTPSGMLEPGSRLAAIGSWMDQISNLKAGHLVIMNEVVKIAFLSSRMQILSFALLDDMPVSTELLEYVESAKQDACDLIELGYGQNLAIAPAPVRHALSYSGFVLVKILRSHCSTDSEVIQDKIERVRQTLSTTTSSPDDTYRKACQVIHMLTYVEDKGLSPPIYTRMGASVVYDLLRVCAEHKYGSGLEIDEQGIDLDGFDWNFWESLV